MVRWLLIMAAVPGCAWVGAGDRADRLGELDEDGDGVLAADEVECGADGDLSPNRFPGNPELPYDGIDNDCQGGDQLDRDGDGYPGITEEDYLALLEDLDALEAEEWPAEQFAGRALDCLDEPGRGSSVNPGVTNDSAYDGTDADCGENNEFDVDGDGFIKTGTDALYEQYLETYGYDFGSVRSGDCDDSDDEVFPQEEGTPPLAGFPNADFDLWYDGIDSDCGENNDFDADGDGFYPAEHQDAFDDYRAAYGAGTAWDDDLPGDCWDSCDAALAPPTLPDTDGDDVVDFCAPPFGFRYPAPVDASAVHVGVIADAAYDAVDADCAGDNDFDQDVDGYSAEGFPIAQVTEFLGWWGEETLGVEYDDCDDEDPGVHPGQQEVLDGRDQDCFGSADTDTAAFRLYEGAGWTNLGQVEVARTDLHWALTVPADHVDWPLGPPGGSFDNVFLVNDLQSGAVVPTIRSVLINCSAVFAGNDLVADGDSLHAGMTYAILDDNFTLSQWTLTWDVGANSYDLADVEMALFEPPFPPANDVSVLLQPSGDLFSVGCGDGVVYGAENGNLGRSDVVDGLVGATSCLAEDDGTGNPRFVTCSASDCAAYAFDTTDPATAVLVPTPVPVEWSSGGWARIERHGDVIALVPTSGTGMTVRRATDVSYFETETVLSAAATTFGDETVVVALVADSPANRILLQWDRAGGALETELGFLDGALGATDVSLGIEGNELLVAATAEGPDDADCSVACPDDDQVGWLLLNLQ